MAQYDIGPRIGIEGEKAFRDAINQINTTMRTLGTEMQAVASQFDRNDHSAKALTSRNEVLNKQIDEQKSKLSELQKGLAASAAKYGENDKVTQGWQQSVNKATADLNNMERELSENQKSLKDVERGFNDSGQKIDEFGNIVEDSEKKANSFSGALKSIGIAIGTATLAAGAAAAQLAKGVIKQFGELEQNLGGAEAVFGEFAASIQKTGEEAYKNLGVSQSNYLATANKMGALFQGSGIEQQKSLELTEKAMQRAADMASVMGIDMQSALDSVAGAAKGNFTMMDNLGVAMNATNIEAYAVGKGLDFVWSKASQAEKAEVAMRMFFENTEQYAGNFAKESTETVTGSFGLWQAALSTFTAGLGSADADMKKLTGNLVEAFNAVIKNVVPIIQNLTAALPEAVAGLLPAIGSLLPLLMETTTTLFEQVLSALLAMFPELIPVAVTALETIADTLIDNLPLIVDGGLQLLLALANGITDALPELIPATVEAVVTIVESLADNLDLLVEAAIGMVFALTEGIIKALPILIEKAPTIIKKLVEAIVYNFPLIFESGLALIAQLGLGLISAIPMLVAKIPEIITAMLAGLARGIADFEAIGKQMIEGLWEGIKSMASWLYDKVAGFFSGIVDGVKDMLDIHSPSRVFAGIGENMAAGLGVGFGEQMRSVARQINDAIPIPTADFAFAGGAGGRGITIRQTNHFGDYKPRDGAAAVRDLNRQLGRLY